MRWLTRAFGGSARAPRDVDGALRAALLAVLDDDLGAAEKLLERAARMDPDGVDAYFALARLYRVRGEVGRAIRIHQNLLLRPDLSAERKLTALADLAGDFRQGGFLRRAIAAYEEVLAQDGQHLAALRALAPLLAEARSYPRAIEVARRLARLEKRSSASEEAALRVQMARAAQAEGRHDEARRAAKAALRKDRGAVEAWLALGELEAERGRGRAALAAWRRIPEIDPASGRRVFPQLEAAYASLGRPREFEAFLRALLEKHPDLTSARIALARTLAARGDADVAVEELHGVLEADPENLEARGMLGRILLSEHRDLEAGKQYGELLDALERRGLLRHGEAHG